VIIHMTMDGAQVLEAGDLKALSVTLEDGIEVYHATANSPLGTPSDDGAAVWLDAAELKSAAQASFAGSAPEGWNEGFDAMIEYARTKGWLSEDGNAVRAHVAS
jgi:hypothetical protein